MQRCGKRTRGSRAAAANRRVGISPYRRVGTQIGTTNGSERTQMRVFQFAFLRVESSVLFWATMSLCNRRQDRPADDNLKVAENPDQQSS
jgi:hypothetical protein